MTSNPVVIEDPTNGVMILFRGGSYNGLYQTLWASGAWHTNELSTMVVSGTPYTTEDPTQGLLVFFQAQSDGKLHETYYSSGWQTTPQPLTSSVMMTDPGPGDQAANDPRIFFGDNGSSKWLDQTHYSGGWVTDQPWLTGPVGGIPMVLKDPTGALFVFYACGSPAPNLCELHYSGGWSTQTISFTSMM